MPNRYAGPEDFSDSRALAKVSLDALAFYASIFFVVDDFGRMVSDPAMLKARAFPYRQEIRGTDCSRWLAECERAGLLASYEVDGTPYLQLTAFSGPRFRRATKSKCPEPPADASNCVQMRAVASNCVQMRADASNCPVPVPGTDIGTDTPLPPTGGAAAPQPLLFGVEGGLAPPKRPRGPKPNAPGYDADPLFGEFWAAYPRKEGKGAAWGAWQKLSLVDKTNAAKQAQRYAMAWAGAPPDREQYRAMPERWLNSRRFEDEPRAWYVQAGTVAPTKAKTNRDFAKEIADLEAVIERMVGEMRKNERECSEMEFAGTLTEQGRANYAALKQDDIDRIRQTRGELEALREEASRG